MALISILVNNILIDFVPETLSIKTENDAFVTDFKVSYTTYPFLVVENRNTITALGPRALASVRRQKKVSCIVLLNGERFTGEIVTAEYLPNHRKCDLRFGSSLVAMMSEKIGNFLPTFSITGAPDFIPYAEKSDEVPAGYDQWPDYMKTFIGKVYPDVNFAFPQMYFSTKYFGADETPEESDEWYYYEKNVNRQGLFGTPGAGIVLHNNTFSVNGQTTNVFNYTAVSPQLLILGILHYVFNANGWKIAGNFTTNDFIRRLALYSEADNLTAVTVGPPIVSYNWGDMVYRAGDNFGYYWYFNAFSIVAPGEYVFEYDVTELYRGADVYPIPVTELRLSWINDPGVGYPLWDGDPYLMFTNNNDANNLSFKGEVTVTVEPNQVPGTLYVWYSLNTDFGPRTNVPVSFSLVKKVNQKVLHAAHPTVQLSRYVPDWTVADFISEIKKTFGVAVTPDENSRTISFDFAKDSLSGAKHILKNAPYSEKYEAPEFTGYVLKYANSEDTYMYIDPQGTTLGKNPDDDYTQAYENKFKLIPTNATTAVLDNVSEKDGVGLMILSPGSISPGTAPAIAPSYDGNVLSIDGTTGLYEVYWKKLMRVLLNGAKITVTLTLTAIELKKINALKNVYFGSQAYFLLSTEAKPTRQDNFTVTLELIAETL
nr:hypothetical protein [uncultured Flavobacterium sp.]